ncbi:linear amide C-N hydrolase [Mycolicibacterium sp.]|uniref:linear amide C-N hydrolase n=1 Tax=Mycolicibacterium sp. TaxID=2320850 RepID=UPI0025DD1C1A|nr:linear amide C-N hydrolase [Mycolicibacterium sp.]
MCTGIRLTADKGDVVYARTMEFDTPLPECVGYFPRGQEFVGDTSSGTDGMRWTNRYAFGGNVLIAGGTHSLGSDGINEKGLVAGVFNLPGFTEFTPVSDGNRDRAIASWQVVLYILGNCATTEEAEAALLSGAVVLVDTDFPFTPTAKGQLPIHLRVGDASGRTIICEWHTPNQPPTILESPNGCIANPPRFEFHLNNWEHFKSLSPYNPSGPITPGSQSYKITMGNGYVGLPGGSNSPDRFIRASLYARDTYAAATGAEAVWTAWHVMNNFDLPRGILRNVTENGVESTEYTIWTSVADTKNLKYFYRVHENPAIYELDLNAQDPDGTAVLMDNRPSSDPTVTVPVRFAAGD